LLRKFKNDLRKFSGCLQDLKNAREELDAVLTEAGELIPKRKRVQEKAQRMMRNNKYNARKTGLVNWSEYKELLQDCKEMKEAIAAVQALRTSAIAERARIMYSVYGFAPHVVVLRMPETKNLGVILDKRPGGFGYFVSNIEESSPAVNSETLQIGDIVVELNGVFLLDADADAIRNAYLAGETECIFVLVRGQKSESVAIDSTVDTSLSSEKVPSKLTTQHDSGVDADALMRDGGRGESCSVTQAGSPDSAVSSMTPPVPIETKSVTPLRVVESVGDYAYAEYDWQVGPNMEAKIEARREWMLSQENLTSNADLMKEWLDLLDARATLLHRGKGSADLPRELQLASNQSSVLPQTKTVSAKSWFQTKVIDKVLPLFKKS